MTCGCTRSQGLSLSICQSQGSRVARQTKQDGGGAEAEELLVLAGGCQSPCMLIDWRQRRLISSCLGWSSVPSSHPFPGLRLLLPTTTAFSSLPRLRRRPLQSGPALSCARGQLSLVCLLLGLTPPLFSPISPLFPYIAILNCFCP